MGVPTEISDPPTLRPYRRAESGRKGLAEAARLTLGNRSGIPQMDGRATRSSGKWGSCLPRHGPEIPAIPEKETRGKSSQKCQARDRSLENCEWRSWKERGYGPKRASGVCGRSESSLGIQHRTEMAEPEPAVAKTGSSDGEGASEGWRQLGARQRLAL